MQRRLTPLLALLGLALVNPASAAKIEDRLVVLEADIQDIVTKAEGLERQVAPGRGFLSETEAVERYQEYVYLHLIGEYEASAEGFFSLVTQGALADAGLHRDAEWYLAEGLMEMENYKTAEARYLVIAEDLTHPFRDDAVRRLLELYVATGAKDKFYETYNAEIVSGRVRPSDLITYSVGKSFYFQGDLLQSKSSFSDLAAESPFYRKGRYFLGAIMLKEGNLDGAIDYFKEIAELSVDTNQDRQLLDLSLMALGRIYMEKGAYAEATTWYDKIGGDSEYLDEKLYEQVWTIIKHKEELRLDRMERQKELDAATYRQMEEQEQDLLQQALRGVEIFLLAYPESDKAAQLKLLRGHLHIQAVEYESALSAYESVISDYTPIQKRFGELATSSEDPSTYFKRVRAMQDGAGGEGEDALPAFAMSMVMADPDLSRALTVYRELERQERVIQESEEIIKLLESALGTGTVGGFEELSYDLTVGTQLALQKQLELLALEEEWLLDGGGENVELEALELRKQREELEAKVRGLETGADVTSVVTDVYGLIDAYSKLHGSVAGAEASTMVVRFKGNHNSLGHALTLFSSAKGDVGSVQSSEFENIRAQFLREVDNVARERVDWAQTLAEAEAVSVDLTRDGFGRLEDFFAESVLRADVGIVDVYWAQKVEVSEELKRVTQERNALRDDLLKRFEIIEQKLQQ